MRKHLDLGMPIGRCARSGVQDVGNAVKLFLPVPVAEVDLHGGLRGQIDGSQCHPALVVGEARAQRRGNWVLLGRKARHRRCSGGVIHLRQQHRAARALREGLRLSARAVTRALGRCCLMRAIVIRPSG